MGVSFTSNIQGHKRYLPMSFVNMSPPSTDESIYIIAACYSLPNVRKVRMDFYASVQKIKLFFSFDSRTGDPENPDLWSEPTVFGQVSILYLKGQCHEMDIVFEGLNSLISTSVYALMVFKVFQKLFTNIYNY
jgi:hypothetical protein